MALEDVIAASVATAREEGVIEGAQGGDDLDPIVTDDVTTEEETTETPETTDESTEETTEETKETVEGAEETVTSEEEVKPEVEAKKDDTTEDEAELGPERDARGKLNRIPHTRVQKIVAKSVQKAVAPVIESVAKAFGVEATGFYDDKGALKVDAVNSAFEGVTALRSRVESMEVVTPIMEQDGDRFIQMLAASNPKQYAKFLAVLDPGFKPEVEKTTTVTGDDPEPQPDAKFTLPDGTDGLTYSLEGHKKHQEWLRRDITRELEAKYEKRFKPIEDERTEIQRGHDLREAVRTKITDMLDEAREWEGFTDNEEAIRLKCAEYPKLSSEKALRRAYQDVVIPKLKADKNTMRASLLKELSKAATSTGAPGGSGSKKPDVVRGEGGEVVTGTEAAIRNALAHAKAGANR